jgi:hypothetical protein
MAGMDWFRWHHGSVTDPKFQLVARKSGSSVAEVIGVWATLLEAASMADVRGCHGVLDFEALDCSLGLDDGKAEQIYNLMTARGLVDSESKTISAWPKRQPVREREDDKSTERVKAFREKKRSETPSNASETPSNAEKRLEEIRGDKSREEEERHAVVIDEVVETETDLRVSRQGAICMVIKSEGIASVNPKHPDLLALIDQGADVGHFASAAKTASEKGKGFAYVLGIVKGQIADAKGIAGRAGVAVMAPSETTYQRSMRLKYEEATGTGQARNVIDIIPENTLELTS